MSEYMHYHFKCDLSRPFVEDFILSEKYKIAGKTAKYLRSFQLEAIRFMFNHFRKNQSCILNDESGLGKIASLSVFLDCVLPNDGSKKCLIITKNEERLMNWQFHLDVLTKLKWKVAFSKYDVGPETVFLSKWDSLQKSITLAFYDFDCIILDVRDGLLSNKICCAHLLRYYEKKISLVVANNDVSMDLDEFHPILRLCDRLDSKYANMKAFEENFALPKMENTRFSKGDSNLLEEYFQKREKLINFCKEFRLRRYRHQYEEYLPLAFPEEHQRSISIWKQTTPSIFNSFLRKSSISLSTSEKTSKEHWMYTMNNEDVDYVSDLDEEDLILTASKETNMSPLIFEESGTDGEETETETTVPIVEQNIVCNASENQEKSANILEKNDQICLKRKTRQSSQKEHGDKSSSKTGKSRRLTTRSNQIRTNSERSLRSNHVTRSKSQKSKYLIADIEVNMEKLTARKRRRKRCKNNMAKKNSGLDDPKTRLNEDLQNSKMFAEMQKIKVNNENGPQNNRFTENTFNNNSETKKIPIVRITKHLNKSVHRNEAFSKIKESGNQSNSSKHNMDLTPTHSPIVISSSSCDDISPNTAANNTSIYGDLQISPDMFSTSEESDLPCAQKNFNSGFRASASGILTCLDILDKDISESGMNTDAINEILQDNNSSIIVLNGSSSSSSPEKEERNADTKQCSTQATNSGNLSLTQTNKITKYLRGKGSYFKSQSLFESELSIQKCQQGINEITPGQKTPTKVQRSSVTTIMEKKIVKSSSSKKSPKISSHNTAQNRSMSNYLKNWLLGSSAENAHPTRRRLDLWFNSNRKCNGIDL